MSPSNLANFDGWSEEREYLGNRFRSMRRSVLTQKADPTDSCPGGIAAFNFCRTRPWRIQMQKFSSRSARYASIVTGMRCNNYSMNNLMHDIGSLSWANAIVCNTTDTVDRLSLSLRILHFISKYKNVTRTVSGVTRETGIQHRTAFKIVVIKNHLVLVNCNTSFNINKMFLQNINSSYH